MRIFAVCSGRPEMPLITHVEMPARTLCITCQSEHDPNNDVSRTGYKSRNDAQVDSELGTKYRQDEENAYEER